MIVSYLLISWPYDAKCTLEILQELYGKFSEEVKNGYYGKLIGEQVKHLEQVAVGAIAPNFTVMTPEGDTISLHSISGKSN